MGRRYKVDYHDEREEWPLWLLIPPAIQDAMIKYQKKHHPLDQLEDLPQVSDLPDKRFNPKPESLDQIMRLISKPPHYLKGVGYKRCQ